MLGVTELFLPGRVADGKPFFDDDWATYYPDGSFVIHEMHSRASICDGAPCRFHPVGCACSDGECQRGAA